jgi:hypothetical protein
MKKLILMSALCLSLGLTSCGGENKGGGDGTDTSSVKTEDTTSTKPDTPTNTTKDSSSNTATDTTQTGDSTKTDTTKKENKSGE